MHLFGLIGYPLSHSFSKKYFTSKFRELGLGDYRYELFEMRDLSGLPALLARPGLQGLNVTIPHKQSVLPFISWLDPVAKATGVVNTIRLQRDHHATTVQGFNTDAWGFRMVVLPMLPGVTDALVLGTGASSRTVAWVLEGEGIQCHFASRHPGAGAVAYDALHELVPRCRLVVNTTPAGMFPGIDSFPSIPYELISSKHILVDLVYNPAMTPFLRKGLERGASVENGLNMLKLQADRAWNIWTNEHQNRKSIS